MGLTIPGPQDSVKIKSWNRAEVLMDIQVLNKSMMSLPSLWTVSELKEPPCSCSFGSQSREGPHLGQLLPP